MLSFLNQYLLGPALPIVLILAGLYFLFRLGGGFFRYPKRTMVGLLGLDVTDRRASLRGMLTALAGTLGVGNITGVACAITAGGAGAVFWMWVSAFAVMPVKFTEIVLACRYRTRDENGELHGSAMLYMKNGLGKPVLAHFFALFLLGAAFTVGNATQISAACETAKNFFGINEALCGALLAAFTIYLIGGGGKRIADFSASLIPALCAGYLLLALIVIFANASLLPAILERIVREAFTPRAGIGGILGVLTAPALRLGTARGVFSNESGCGTAPMAHASAHAEPAEQGFFGIIEVFVDTLLLCTMTAFVILIGGEALSAYDGTPLAIHAFSYHLGEWVSWFLAASVILYAIASCVAWAYYGMEALRYFTKNKTAEIGYRLFYGAFCFVGALFPLNLIWEIADATISIMTCCNVTCLLLLSGEVREETLAYLEKKRRR